MIKLKKMNQLTFETFKTASQREYAANFAAVEDVSVEIGLKNVAEQFDRLVPQGLETSGQLFFEAIEELTEKSVGYLWLGIQDRFGRKVTSINEIIIKSDRRGEGFGRALMNCIEDEAKKAGSKRIRLHVFQRNEIARKLYLSMGFEPSSVDMFKLI